MTKRAYGKFTRSPADDYATPRTALEPLLPYLASTTAIIEPCPGAGVLARHLIDARFEVLCHLGDARTADYKVRRDEIFVTNPPWSRDLLHPIIMNLSNQAPTWLLFDSDWIHTLQAIPYLPRLNKIVSIGRVKWIADSDSVGFDNACWHLFSNKPGPICFHGRTEH